MTEKQAWDRFIDLKNKISASTAPIKDETEEAKRKRIDYLLTHPVQFCKYYFEQYFDPKQGGAELGWFHKKGLKDITLDPDYFGCWEWPREHAKSVVADVFVPMYLKARGEVSGVVLASHNSSNASKLLSDLQAQLESNRRYINDFGEQYNYGSWTDGYFVTRDGTGFWAIGKGESPRGLKEAAKRPNLCLVDDFDDDEECQNEKRVNKSLRWLKGALLGAIAIKQRRFLMLGNRIHKKSCLAKFVGDVEEGDLKNPKVKHIKVYALENPKNHQKDEGESGVPAWKERYTRADWEKVFDQMGYAESQREYFHNAIEIGTEFKEEWIRFAEKPIRSLRDFQIVVTYNDPSYRGTTKSDFKAISAIGKKGKKWYLIDCWVRQASIKSMVEAHYDMAERLEAMHPPRIIHYIEAVFLQDDMIDDYKKESEVRNYMLPIKEDKRDKPEKKGRISAAISYWERSLLEVNKDLQKTKDWQTMKSQWIAHPFGHDDGPDSMEGGLMKIKEHLRAEAPMSMGGDRRINDY